MNRNYYSMVNICADGLIDVITDNYQNAEARIDEWIGKYLDETEIGTMAFNVNYHVSYIPSIVWDTAWQKTNGRKVTQDELKSTKHWSYKFVEAHNMGVEPYSIAINSVKKRNAQAWFSVRMNEYHYLNNEFASATFWQEHPEFRMGDDKPFDYSHKEVRDYYVSYIKELCENYDIDGIELDMLRGPEFYNEVSGTEDLTDFVREIRQEINKIADDKNKNICLSARVFFNNNSCIKKGYNPVEWAKEDLIDVLTISNFFIPTTFYAPIKEWKELIGDSKCKINVATDFCSYCTKWDAPYTRYMKNNTYTLKGFAANAFSSGADGIYTFNVMLNGYTKDVDLNLEADFKEFSSYESAVSGMRTHIYTETPEFDEIDDLPLNQGVLKINTAKKPEKMYKIILGTIGKEKQNIKLNGFDIDFTDICEGKEYNPEIKSPPIVFEASETAEFVYEYNVSDISVVNEGVNKIYLDSTSDIIWLQIDVI